MKGERDYPFEEVGGASSTSNSSSTPTVPEFRLCHVLRLDGPRHVRVDSDVVRLQNPYEGLKGKGQPDRFEWFFSVAFRIQP